MRSSSIAKIRRRPRATTTACPSWSTRRSESAGSPLTGLERRIEVRRERQVVAQAAVGAIGVGVASDACEAVEARAERGALTGGLGAVLATPFGARAADLGRG